MEGDGQEDFGLVTSYYDKIIIGAGIYGLYAAIRCGRQGQSVLVLEEDPSPFMRATYVNQARVHQGYHYPRSLSTASKSAHYFQRFCDDFGFCINDKFNQIYATSAQFSWANAEQFKKFCAAASISCEEVNPEKYFKRGMCDGAFLTREYTYDAMILRDHMLERIGSLGNVELLCSAKVVAIEEGSDAFSVRLDSGAEFETGFLLNATYASTNQVLGLAGMDDTFQIKYELCEIILCDVSSPLQDCGITLMDGPFFSIMPFGKTGKHSLTSVTFTPHATSYEKLPTFKCQLQVDKSYCSPDHLGNCDVCPARPQTAFPYMANLARKYLRAEYEFSYDRSLFSMKPILMRSEIDDSRPTVIKKERSNPDFYSVLSGKINTIYDLDEVLT